MNKANLNAALNAKLKHYRITAEEYEKIKGLLGREPNNVEWALFSALWSEHCSYKSSKIHLSKFSYRNARTESEEGENAGQVDLGQGEKIVFKMESHNHPSFIEPYQGAATGVGGILRDIFTMGARPIALADYLCFGEVAAPRMKPLISGVVAGIGGYGNCVGVATVTGQTEFHSSYNNNILVNAMAVGLVQKDMPMVMSSARCPGAVVVYVGAKTGKDGIHGASMASESFSGDTESKKPNVQIGDPFFEKLLIEACLEALKTGKVLAMQDMGAAGLTSSSFEMSAKGGLGLKLDLTRVPLRDQTMSPEEILLSESQERMLMILQKEDFSQIEKLFANWDLEAVILGEVTESPEIELSWRGEILTRIDPKLIVDSAPRYDRPSSFVRKSGTTVSQLPKRISSFEGFQDLFHDLVQSPRFQSKEKIFNQYDQRVGAKTFRDCSGSVAILRLPSQRNLGITVGCRGSLMRMNPEIGAQDAVLYPSLALACKGLEAMAVTDCLNFGNPEKPEIMAEFITSVEAIAKSAKALDAPVVSGNVSFYNETHGQNITSTPATGVLGLGDLDPLITPSDFFIKSTGLEKGDKVLLIRSGGPRGFSSVAECLNEEMLYQGEVSLGLAVDFIQSVRSWVVASGGGIKALRPTAQGGIFWTLIKMTCGLGQPLAAEGASLPTWGFQAAKDLSKKISQMECLSEDLYSVMASGKPEALLQLQKEAKAKGFETLELGQLIDDKFEFSDLKLDLKELRARVSEVSWI